jgi:hypothetical protein
MLWAWLSRSWHGWRSAVQIVRPETIIAWHRRGFRLFWTWKSRHQTGRPAAPPDVRDLIRELDRESPLGAPRIHGELQKLGISVSQSTVAKYMRRHLHPPSQTWRTFLVNHANQIMAADLFVVPNSFYPQCRDQRFGRRLEVPRRRERTLSPALRMSCGDDAPIWLSWHRGLRMHGRTLRCGPT